MRTKSAILVVLALTGCGIKSATFDRMADGKWANNPSECGNRFTTFNGKAIRWHLPDGTVDFGHIAVVGEASPTDVMLTVEPSDAIKRAAQKPGARRLPGAITMGFNLEGDHLQLRAIVGDSGRGGAIDADAVETRLFNLVRCPG